MDHTMQGSQRIHARTCCCTYLLVQHRIRTHALGGSVFAGGFAAVVIQLPWVEAFICQRLLLIGGEWWRPIKPVCVTWPPRVTLDGRHTNAPQSIPLTAVTVSTWTSQDNTIQAKADKDNIDGVRPNKEQTRGFSESYTCCTRCTRPCW